MGMGRNHEPSKVLGPEQMPNKSVFRWSANSFNFEQGLAVPNRQVQKLVGTATLGSWRKNPVGHGMTWLFWADTC